MQAFKDGCERRQTDVSFGAKKDPCRADAKPNKIILASRPNKNPCLAESIYLSIYLSLYLSIHLSIYLSVYLCLYLSSPPFFAVLEG